CSGGPSAADVAPAVAGRRGAHHTPDHAERRTRTEEPVKLDKQELVQMLRAQGDNDTADQVESRLPDEIDTDRDSPALEAVGLDGSGLQAKLAAGRRGGA